MIMSRTAWNKGVTHFQPRPCLCGCGQLIQVRKYLRKDGNSYSYGISKFIKSHVKRGIDGCDPSIHEPRRCLCGCGQITKERHGRYNRFLEGHENIGRQAWNKGRPFPESSRRKMSLARLGKEPPNKAPLDRQQLFDLYILLKNSAGEISILLGISEEAIKRRIHSYGWSRSTKASCNLPSFKEKMRRIRIQVMTSRRPVSPNRLEKLVYAELDRRGVQYYPQCPLYSKFVVDAFIPDRNMVLEILGQYWHRRPEVRKKDAAKRAYLEKCGHVFRELWENDAKVDLVGSVGRALAV